MSRTFLQNGITNQYFRLFVADFHCHCIFRVFLVCIFRIRTEYFPGKYTECGKMRTRKTQNTDTFYAVCLPLLLTIYCWFICNSNITEKCWSIFLCYRALSRNLLAQSKQETQQNNVLKSFQG